MSDLERAEQEVHEELRRNREAKQQLVKEMQLVDEALHLLAEAQRDQPPPPPAYDRPSQRRRWWKQ